MAALALLIGRLSQANQGQVCRTVGVRAYPGAGEKDGEGGKDGEGEKDGEGGKAARAVGRRRR